MISMMNETLYSASLLFLFIPMKEDLLYCNIYCGGISLSKCKTEKKKIQNIQKLNIRINTLKTIGKKKIFLMEYDFYTEIQEIISGKYTRFKFGFKKNI